MTIPVIILVFFITFFSYRTGIRDGQRMKENKSIENIIKGGRKKETPEDRIAKGMKSILDYNNRRGNGQ